MNRKELSMNTMKGTPSINIIKFLASLERNVDWGKEKTGEFYEFCIQKRYLERTTKLVSSRTLEEAFQEFKIKQRKEVGTP